MESEIRRYLREGESYVRNRAIADVAFSFAEITADFAFHVCSFLRSR